ncbi:MAG: RsmB/NOP family class I SAM-dependent RNA methyltransferase [Alphaproteobacteria bacterium]
MTPGARLQTAIDLLAGILASPDTPAEQVMNDGLRARRYAGSKDRAAISSTVYGVLRRRAQIDWWLGRSMADPPDARNRVLTFTQIDSGLDAEALASLCDGTDYGPATMSARETRVAVELTGVSFDKSCQPPSTRANIPDWLWPVWSESLGDDAETEAACLNDPAGVDLRVNTLKAERDAVIDELSEYGIPVVSTPISPVGLRLTDRKPLKGLAAYREGRIEIQDEGSQIAARLCDAKPGMKIVDFCAGAGGKSLQLAADLQNKGRIIACDTDKRRLDEAALRLKRAGAFCVERRLLKSERDSWVKQRAVRHNGGFDRVLVDAPCSGSGTWRRRPDDRWRLKPETLERFGDLQYGICDSAARLVRPGGRLIYVTCSLFRQENEAIVEKFLAGRSDFHTVPVANVWRETIGGKCPVSGKYLQLSPGRTGTDGFFVAILERRI